MSIYWHMNFFRSSQVFVHFGQLHELLNLATSISDDPLPSLLQTTPSLPLPLVHPWVWPASSHRWTSYHRIREMPYGAKPGAHGAPSETGASANDCPPQIKSGLCSRVRRRRRLIGSSVLFHRRHFSSTCSRYFLTFIFSWGRHFLRLSLKYYHQFCR